MSIWVWLGFLGFIGLLLALDLGVVNKKDHVITVPEAISWSIFYVVLALLFNGVIYFGMKTIGWTSAKQSAMK